MERLSLPAKARLGGEVVVSYARVRRGLRRQELEALVAALRAEKARPRQLSHSELRRLAAVVMAVLSLLPTDSRCLMRSLVLLRLLARRGVGSTLVIGVRTVPEFAAHAWIECEEEALLPSGDGEFTPLTTV